MEPVIRRFNIGDYESVIDLWHQANLPFRPHGRDSKEQIDKQIKNGTTIFLVAEVEGRIVGTVLGTHDGRKGWINRLAVGPKFRRQDIASNLVKELEDVFKQRRLEVTACLIENENKISMDFFKALGYEEFNVKYFSKRKSLES